MSFENSSLGYRKMMIFVIFRVNSTKEYMLDTEARGGDAKEKAGTCLRRSFGKQARTGRAVLQSPAY